MKKIINRIFALTLLVALFASCKKDENKDYYTGGTSPVLSVSSTNALVLDIAFKNNVAVTFTWTNPNYQFTTGISSQDVNYVLQFDTTGSNFTNPNIQEKGISKDLSSAITVGELNGYLSKMNLSAYKPHNMEIRVKSTLINGSVPLYSNVIKIVVTPYLDFSVIPPGTPALGYTDGQLFLVGSATAGGWNNPVPVPTQQFTQIDVAHYKLTVNLVGGQEYLMLPVNGDWSKKYGNACGSNSCNNAASDNFKQQGDNIKAPGATGSYTITVNFITGKFTVQ
jgi:hypothetical protein